MRRTQPNLFRDQAGLYRSSETGVIYFADTVSVDWVVNPPATLQVFD